MRYLILGIEKSVKIMVKEKSGKSSHYPQNTSVYIPYLDKKAEIFWQTVNANHLLENYTDRISQWEKEHDLKFNDFKNLLSGNTVFKEGKTKDYAIAYFENRGNYYYISYKMAERFKTSFIIIITAYATKRSKYISEYEEYQKLIREKFGK